MVIVYLNFISLHFTYFITSDSKAVKNIHLKYIYPSRETEEDLDLTTE